MEIHHHSHTARKKWTHYFWEFLMLFLAVFCGFLAENQREHFIEQKREKQFMRSLVADLQKDTASLQNMMVWTEYVIKGMDTLRQSVYNIGTDDSAVKKLYVYSRQYLRPIGIDFTDRTSSQLKNAGGMRLIRNELVADSIISYWFGIEAIKYLQERGISFTNEAIKLRLKILDSRYLLEADYGTEFFPVRNNPVLLKKDPELLSEFANHVHNTQQFLRYLQSGYRIQNKSAVGLINIIKKEYHLK